MKTRLMVKAGKFRIRTAKPEDFESRSKKTVLVIEFHFPKSVLIREIRGQKGSLLSFASFVDKKTKAVLSTSATAWHGLPEATAKRQLTRIFTN